MKSNLNIFNGWAGHGDSKTAETEEEVGRATKFSKLSIPRITQFANNTFLPNKYELLAEELSARIGVLMPNKEKKKVILDFLAQKELTGDLKVIQ